MCGRGMARRKVIPLPWDYTVNVAGDGGGGRGKLVDGCIALAQKSCMSYSLGHVDCLQTS